MSPPGDEGTNTWGKPTERGPSNLQTQTHPFKNVMFVYVALWNSQISHTYIAKVNICAYAYTYKSYTCKSYKSVRTSVLNHSVIFFCSEILAVCVRRLHRSNAKLCRLIKITAECEVLQKVLTALNICEIKWLRKFHLTMNSCARERKITFIVHLQ